MIASNQNCKSEPKIMEMGRETQMSFYQMGYKNGVEDTKKLYRPDDLLLKTPDEVKTERINLVKKYMIDAVVPCSPHYKLCYKYEGDKKYKSTNNDKLEEIPKSLIMYFDEIKSYCEKQGWCLSLKKYYFSSRVSIRLTPLDLIEKYPLEFVYQPTFLSIFLGHKSQKMDGGFLPPIVLEKIPAAE